MGIARRLLAWASIGVCVVVWAGCEGTKPAGPEERAASAPPAKADRSIADRLSCSSLCLLKHPTEQALAAIAGMGYKYVDLSCLTWAPHASVVEMHKDFEKEVSRVERLLAKYDLGVSNLTYDSLEIKPFDQYTEDFRLLARLAHRLDARLINIMAPSKKYDFDEAVTKLRTLQAIAAEHGVLLSVETHVNQLTELPADAARLCERVPGLGLTLDPSHYYVGPNKGKPFDFLYPKVYGTGFRAAGTTWDQIQMPWGQGPIDFDAIVRGLEAAGYKGFYVTEYLEGFRGMADVLPQCRAFLAWGKQLRLPPVP